MEYIKIDSSNVSGYSYDTKEKKLYIKFKNHREYIFSDVSQEEYENLINAESFGKVLYATIVNKKQSEELW